MRLAALLPFAGLTLFAAIGCITPPPAETRMPRLTVSSLPLARPEDAGSPAVSKDSKPPVPAQPGESNAAVPATPENEPSNKQVLRAQTTDPWATGVAEPQKQRSRVINFPLPEGTGQVKAVGAKPNQSLPYWNLRMDQWRTRIAESKPIVSAGDPSSTPPRATDWATYLDGIHAKIHHVFTDSFMASLDSLGKEHPINKNPELYAEVELVIDGATGKLASERIIHASGIRLFDAGVLASIAKAFPASPAPESIMSNDGRVYVHWQLHRNPDHACSTWFARGLKLNAGGESESHN